MMLKQVLLGVALVFACASCTLSDTMPRTPSGSATQVEAATRAYLSQQDPAQKAKSNAYFEGGYWLQLWDFMSGALAAVLLLTTRMSARMRDRAVRLVRFQWLQTIIYWGQYVVVFAVLTFPLTIYAKFFREHQYQISNQPLVGWLIDFLIGLVVQFVLGSILLVPTFALIRRSPARWHVYGAGVLIAFFAFATIISPVFVDPLFNEYAPLAQGPMRERILSLARANGVPSTEIFQADESRQHKRISANVSGAFGTTRISLNDNLIQQCTLPEVEVVMGHEIGHYVLHHRQFLLLFYSVLLAGVMALLRVSIGWFVGRFGERWGVAGPADVAVLPLALALFAAMVFFTIPLRNTVERTVEAEADIFTLNASRHAESVATIALKMAEYSKLDPSPLEELIFFDHPSGATRIRRAMRWRAENPEPSSTAVEPQRAP